MSSQKPLAFMLLPLKVCIRFCAFIRRVRLDDVLRANIKFLKLKNSTSQMFVRKHIFLLVTLILIVVVISLPNLFLIWTGRVDNWPLSVNSKLAHMEEETYIYAAHVHQIINGYFKGDAYLWEYRSSPFPFLGELGSIIPIAILSKITRSVPMGFILSDLVFPALLFLLIFYGLRKFNHQKSFSITSSLAIITIPFLSMLLPKISSFGTQLTGDSANAMFFSRTPHPQISSLYLFGSLFLTAWILKNPTTKIIFLWAIVLGFSIYASPFVASTVFLGTIFISPLLLKKVSKSKLAAASVVVVLIGLPFIFNMLQLQKLFENSDFLLRTTFTTQFLFPRQLRYLMFAILLFKLKKNSLSGVILAYIFAASLLIDGHQLIAGRNIEGDHWISRVLAPISTLAIFLIIQKFIEKFNQKRIIFFWIGASIALIVIAFTKQLLWTRTNLDEFKQDNLETLTTKILQESKKDDVIGSLDPQIEKHVTGLTGRRVYLAPGDRTVASSDEQIQRICDLAILSKNKEQRITRNVLNYALGFYVWSKNDVADITSNIEECIKSNPQVPRYRLDYLVEKDEPLASWLLIPISNK